MKTLKFEVELEFTEDVTTRERSKIVDRVLHALVGEIDHGSGLAPDDAWTKRIKVKSETARTSFVKEHTF